MHSNMSPEASSYLQGTRTSDLLRVLIDKLGWEDHLRKTGADWESRWDNCQELITFAADVEDSNLCDLSLRDDLWAQGTDGQEELDGTNDLHGLALPASEGAQPQ